MIRRELPMSTLVRKFSNAPFGAGVVLVFLGLSSTLGFTPVGMLASGAAILALLYAGAVWLGAPPRARSAPPVPQSLLVFNRDGCIVFGPGRGTLITSPFPPPVRAQIQRGCAAALAGSSTRIPCWLNERVVLFDALPVRDAEGTIVYGILTTPETVPATAADTV